METHPDNDSTGVIRDLAFPSMAGGWLARTLLILFLTLLSLGWVISNHASPASADASERPEVRSWQGCGVVAGAVALYSVKGKRVSCQVARRVGIKWRAKVLGGECERFKCRARGFLCRAKRPAYISYPVRCKQGSRQVYWRISVD
jgi:hypothetical protein